MQLHQKLQNFGLQEEVSIVVFSIVLSGGKVLSPTITSSILVHDEIISTENKNSSFFTLNNMRIKVYKIICFLK